MQAHTQLAISVMHLRTESIREQLPLCQTCPTLDMFICLGQVSKMEDLQLNDKFLSYVGVAAGLRMTEALPGEGEALTGRTRDAAMEASGDPA